MASSRPIVTRNSSITVDKTGLSIRQRSRTSYSPLRVDRLNYSDIAKIRYQPRGHQAAQLQIIRKPDGSASQQNRVSYIKSINPNSLEVQRLYSTIKRQLSTTPTGSSTPAAPSAAPKLAFRRKP